MTPASPASSNDDNRDDCCNLVQTKTDRLRSPSGIMGFTVPGADMPDIGGMTKLRIVPSYVDIVRCLLVSAVYSTDGVVT
jgi:hypothetical protein